MVRSPWLVTLLLYTLAGFPEPRLPWIAGPVRVSRKMASVLALLFLISVYFSVVSEVCLRLQPYSRELLPPISLA
jgi:hypothetical protein